MTLTEKLSLIAVHYSRQEITRQFSRLSFVLKSHQTAGIFHKRFKVTDDTGRIHILPARSMSRDYRVPVQRIHFRYLFIAHDLTKGAELSPSQGDEARPIFRLYLRKRLLSRDEDSWSMTRPHLAPQVIVSFHNLTNHKVAFAVARKSAKILPKSQQMHLAFCAMRNRASR